MEYQHREPVSLPSNIRRLDNRRRGRHDDFGLTGGVHDTIGFIESVERMRGPGLTLCGIAKSDIMSALFFWDKILGTYRRPDFGA